MEKSQNKTIVTQFSKILSKDFTSTVKQGEDDSLVNVKFNTKDHLTKDKIKQLDALGMKWGLEDYRIKRSGTGVTMEFFKPAMAMEQCT